MIRIVLLMAMAVMLVWSPASLAHGPEGHGGDDGTETASPAAPDAASASDGSQAPAAQAEDAGQSGPQLTVSSVLENLHPATVHFPIGLLIAAALVELLAWRRRSQRLAQAATVMVGAGAIGAVIAALFGWIHTGLWFGGDGLVQWHRWLGTNLAALALLTWWAGRYPDYRKAFRILLFAMAALLLVQGYLGGELAHGPHHLASHD